MRAPYWALVEGIWHLYDNALGQKEPEPNCLFAPRTPPPDAKVQAGIYSVFGNPQGHESCRACWIGGNAP